MRMPARSSTLALIAFLASPLAQGNAVPASRPADPAAAQINTFYTALLDTMKRGKELGIEGRYRQLKMPVEASFDLPGMARLSVGPAWNMISEADRMSIIDAFERMTIANYAKNFASFGGEQFTIDGKVQMRGEDKIVESKLVGSDHTATSFNYRLHKVGDSWKIVDVYLDGYVSQLALRRSDFSSTVASSGAGGLVKKINELVDKQMASK